VGHLPGCVPPELLCVPTLLAGGEGGREKTSALCTPCSAIAKMLVCGHKPTTRHLPRRTTPSLAEPLRGNAVAAPAQRPTHRRNPRAECRPVTAASSAWPLSGRLGSQGLQPAAQAHGGLKQKPSFLGVESVGIERFKGENWPLWNTVGKH